MANCAKCGATLNQGATFCGSCGAPVGTATPAAGSASATPAAGSSGLTPNVAGLLSYILWPITSILFLVLEPYNKDKFVRFHAFQSLFFGIACIALSIGAAIITFVIGLVPIIGWLIDLVLWLVVWLGLIAAWIFLMYKAYNNEKYMFPIIGKLAAQQAG